MPNVKELESITDDSRYNPNIDTNFFPNVYLSTPNYWSTTNAIAGDAVWDVWFKYGGFIGSFCDKGNNINVRCVRARQFVSFDYYCDDDSDTYIDSSIDGTCTGSGCEPQGCQTTPGDDCNDNDSAIYPGASEICDGKDNDCNNITDDIAPIGNPALLSPSNGATGISTTPTLDWGDLSGATSYDVEVCTDSNCSSVVRSDSELTSSQWPVSPTLSQGTQYWWRAKANNSCGSGSWSTSWSFTTQIQTRFEEDDPAITYLGTWNNYSCISCSGGALKYSNQTGAKATFLFNGTGIKWIVTKANMLGKAKVRLDGKPPTGILVDLYSPSPQWQVVLQKIGSTSGTHTLSIEVSGQKNSSSTGYFIDIDAFEVIP